MPNPRTINIDTLMMRTTRAEKWKQEPVAVEVEDNWEVGNNFREEEKIVVDMEMESSSL